MANNVIQERAIEQAQYGFEKEMEDFCRQLKEAIKIKFDYQFGNVRKDTHEDHMMAKYSKADLTITFKQFITLKIEGDGIKKTTFPIDTPIQYELSLKEIKSRIPRRVWEQTLNIQNFEYEDYFILDFNDFKDMLNSNYVLLRYGVGNKKYLLIKDGVFGGYYLYNFKKLEKNMTNYIYLEYEGEPVYEKMKVLITKNTDKFKDLNELFRYFVNLAYKDMQNGAYREMKFLLEKRLKDIKEIKRAPINEGKAGSKYKGNKWVVNCSVKVS